MEATWRAGSTPRSQVEEEPVTQYESVPDPNLSWLEKAALKQVNEAYDCWQTEVDPRSKALWEQFYRMELEGKDIHSMFPAEILPPVVFESNKGYVRDIVHTRRNLQPLGMELKPEDQLPPDWSSYREAVDREGAPSQEVVEKVAAPA